MAGGMGDGGAAGRAAARAREPRPAERLGVSGRSAARGPPRPGQSVEARAGARMAVELEAARPGVARPRAIPWTSARRYGPLRSGLGGIGWRPLPPGTRRRPLRREGLACGRPAIDSDVDTGAAARGRMAGPGPGGGRSLVCSWRRRRRADRSLAGGASSCTGAAVRSEAQVAPSPARRPPRDWSSPSSAGAVERQRLLVGAPRARRGVRIPPR